MIVVRGGRGQRVGKSRGDAVRWDVMGVCSLKRTTLQRSAFLCRADCPSEGTN